eukprot:gene7637-8478_t
MANFEDAINEARKAIFWQRLRTKNEIIDLSLLPPCQKTLRLHIKRSNFVAMMWERAIDPIMMLEDPTEHGWKEDLQPNWGEEPYPDDMEELLLHYDPANSDGNEYDESEDSDIEIFDVD